MRLIHYFNLFPAHRPAIRSCEYLISSIRQIPNSLANSANTFGGVSKHMFEGHTHTFCFVRCLFHIVLVYRSVDMQPSNLFLCLVAI